MDKAAWHLPPLLRPPLPSMGRGEYRKRLPLMRSPPKTLTMGNKAKFRPSGQVFVTLAAKEMCMKTCLVSVQLGHDRKLRCRGKSHLCYHQSPIATPTDSTAMHRVHFQITASYPTALTAIH